MGDPGREIVYPTIDQICEVNRRMVEESGGLFLPPQNLNNLNALEYILVAIEFTIYRREIYPNLKEKAAAIAHQIISRHVFIDGNKRTGFHIAWEFLQANGIRLFLDLTLVDLAETVASGNAGYDEVLQWLHSHQGT